eukprot:NODE_1728_length_1236_cov_64.885482_g1713_i0.p1 GENE.NODE_1728_length_1236_cov_64.885482_g1713_i0~~NODE_1728_length_1236_cov_64.885482_g1713_i0.p1  ORF type:complete len:352 (-),score=52.97 NODE_1728_length_1236_cov_64.885482_g1713_i0:98-1153(-)
MVTRPADASSAPPAKRQRREDDAAKTQSPQLLNPLLTVDQPWPIHSAFSSMHPHVMSATDENVKLWNRNSGDDVDELELDVGRVAGHRNGWALAGFGAHALLFAEWSERDGLRECGRVEHYNAVTAVTVLPSQFIVTGCLNGSVRSFVGDECHVKVNVAGRVADLHPFKDSNQVAYSAAVAGLIDIRTASVVQTWAHSDRGLSVATFDQLVATGCADGCVRVFDMRQHSKCLACVNMQHNDVRSAEFLTSDVLIVGCWDAHCSIRPVAALDECIATVGINDDVRVYHATAVNGSGMAVVSTDSSTSLVDVSQWTQTGTQFSSQPPTVAVATTATEHADKGDDELRLPPGFD